jgi:hypothetical protein
MGELAHKADGRDRRPKQIRKRKGEESKLSKVKKECTLEYSPKEAEAFVEINT